MGFTTTDELIVIIGFLARQTIKHISPGLKAEDKTAGQSGYAAGKMIIDPAVAFFLRSATSCEALCVFNE